MSYQEKGAEGSGSSVFIMALVFVFLILAAQYESWSLPDLGARGVFRSPSSARWAGSRSLGYSARAT